MKTIQFEFNGTSHGEGYSGQIKGLPAGFAVNIEQINLELACRKSGFGRSVRQHESADVVKFLNLVGGKTTEQPLDFFVANAKSNHKPQNFSAVRSGHIDLVGAEKYGTTDIRNLNERASGRSSLCYVVLGAICKQILQTEYNVKTFSCIKQIGKTVAKKEILNSDGQYSVEPSCLKKMQKAVSLARNNGDSLGGVARVFAQGLKMGQLGDFFPYDRRLDAIICANLMAIPAVKAVEFGLGKGYADKTGRQVVDKLQVENGQIAYKTNNAGGIVGGITNGQELSVLLTVKPVPTIENVETIDLISKQPAIQHFERADTCIVQTVGIVAQNILATVLLDELLTYKQL